MHELMFQAGVIGMSERSELIPCIYIMIIQLARACDTDFVDSIRTKAGSVSAHFWTYQPIQRSCLVTCSILYINTIPHNIYIANNSSPSPEFKKKS